MNYRPFGKLDWQASALGFGCMRLPTREGNSGAIREDRAADMLHYAIDHGVNYLDTAYPYHQGESEPFLGRVLQGRYREKVRLATKLPCWKVEKTADFDALLTEQLNRLQTERIDFYLLHALNEKSWRKMHRLDVLSWLEKAQAEGRIGWIGFSFHDEFAVFKDIVDAYHGWDFCQIQYNFMDEGIQAGTEGLLYAAGKGLGVVVMEPLRGGSLARSVPEDIQALWDQALEKRSPAEWALRWVWNHPEVSVVLSGMTAPDQVEENCRIAAAAEPNALSETELDIIDQVRQRYRERIKVDCTACGYCMPCPNGVNIPRIFSVYNDRFIFGDERWSHLMYTFASNAGEHASNCVECGECEEVCPQGILIIETLKKCHEVLSQPLE